MLILERLIKEEIYIGEDIIIRICHLGDKRVSIGITAPKELKISRSEGTVEK